MLHRFAFVGAILAAAAFTVPATAAEITYSFTGTFDVNLSGSVLPDVPLVLTGIGDTEFSQDFDTDLGTIRGFQLSSLTIAGAGQSIDLGTDYFFGTGLSGLAEGGVGFGSLNNGSIGLVIATFLPLDQGVYDGMTAFGPVGTEFAGGGTISIGGMDAFLAGATGEVTFQALLSGVPEPASWAMMIGGFGLIGAALRRTRPTVAVRFG